MLRATFLCCLFLLLAPISGRADPKQEAELYCSRAKAYLAEKKVDQAVADFDRAIQLNPEEATTYCLRGCVYALKGDLNRAVADQTEALRRNPKLVAAYGERATAYMLKGERELALADFSQAIRLCPSEPDFYYDRGRIYLFNQDFGRAAADFNEAIRLQPKHVSAHCERGATNTALGEYGKAAADFTEAIRLEPTCVRAQANLAWLLATCPTPALRDGKRAVGCGLKACELTQWREPIHVSFLAAACAEAGIFPEAVRLEKKALEMAASRPAAETEPMRARLRLYEQGKPYRTPPASAGEQAAGRR